MLRLHRDSIPTERAYVEWIVRFVRFHGMRSRDHLFPAEPMIAAFLTDLAGHGHVACRDPEPGDECPGVPLQRVLHHAMEGRINAVRADKKINVPVVMTREEVAAVLSLMDGTAQLVAKLLYGSGLRIMEAVRLGVKDIDYQMKPLTVRSGKGDKDRVTTFPVRLMGGASTGAASCAWAATAHDRGRSVPATGTVVPTSSGSGKSSTEKIWPLFSKAL